MKQKYKLVIGFLAVLLFALTAEAWAYPITKIIEPLWNISTPPDLAEDDIPVIQATPLTPEPSEAPEEDDLIEMALMEQGYYSDAVPLDYLYQDILRSACERYSVPYALALAVIETESGFNVDAVGVDGQDIGLFQIRESNHEWLSDETGADPKNPAGNIECGVWLLGYLLEEYDNTESALTAYRWGHDNGTRKYANAVIELSEKWSTIQ